MSEIIGLCKLPNSPACCNSVSLQNVAHSVEEEQTLKTENKMMWLTECLAGSLVPTFDASKVQAHPCAESYVLQGSQAKNKVSLEVKPEKMCKCFHLHASVDGFIGICGGESFKKTENSEQNVVLVVFLFTLDICGGKKKRKKSLNLCSTGHSHVDRTDQI